MTYTLFLIFGVPALAIAGLCLALCRASGRCSRREEQELDLACYAALEGDLRNFNPDPSSPPGV